MIRRASLFSTLALCAGLRRLDLEASEGETAGKYAFPGGEPEATCKACYAVMEHLQREMGKPYYDDYHGGVKYGRGIDSKKLNRLSHVDSVLDPSKCMTQMKNYDLAYIGGENRFHYNGGQGNVGAGYPVHMELNDWAKNELGMFCESLIEEFEEQMHDVMMEVPEPSPGAALPEKAMLGLSDRMCKETLDLCKPPPPPKKAKKKKEKKEKEKKDPTREERLKKAREVFANLDTNKDKFVTREEMETRLQTADLKGEQTVEGEMEKFFSIDKDGNGKIDFYEYKFLWVSPKNKGPVRVSLVDQLIAAIERLRARLPNSREELWDVAALPVASLAAISIGGLGVSVVLGRTRASTR